jgi:hypothetical protein
MRPLPEPAFWTRAFVYSDVIPARPVLVVSFLYQVCAAWSIGLNCQHMVIQGHFGICLPILSTVVISGSSRALCGGPRNSDSALASGRHGQRHISAVCITHIIVMYVLIHARITSTGITD